MRFLGLILFVTFVAIGCNADPRCRRETALLRAEILDLEDKLAFAHAGSHYSGDVHLSPYGPIVSDTIIDSNGSPVIYDSYDPGVTYSTDQTIHSNSPLEVQHQIFPNESSITTQPSLRSEDLDISIESPGLPAKIDSLLPNSKRIKTLNVPDLTPPTDNGSEIQRPRTRRRARPAPEMEITLDDLTTEDAFDIEIESDMFITEIIVNRDASGGENVDGLFGDEGLNLLVQPRTANGSVYLEAGELSVDLIDPKASPDNQTVGHWQFMPAETELFFAKDRHEGDGILLHLPWEQNLPTTRNLVVSVSFITSDGRNLSTSSRLRVDPPLPGYSPDDPQVAGWTERDTRWEIGTHNQSARSEARHWTESSPQHRHNDSIQLVEDDLFESQNDETFQRPRVKATPASSTRPTSQLPRWRPVR